MRLLAATEPEGQTRVQLTHQLYKTYWIDNKDVTDNQVLQSVASVVGWDVDVDKVLSNEDVKDELRRSTDEAVARGAFGVPRSICIFIFISCLCFCMYFVCQFLGQ